MDHIPAPTNARADFYARLESQAMAPLWEVLRRLVTPQPTSPAVPHLWRWRDVEPYLREAGELITAKEAERRVLILENPGLKGLSAITRSLYAGLQLILPGEVAPAHRHTQSALRFVVDGEGAYTAVDGERTTMRPGDFVITPSWTWHDHGNDSDRPMVWLDGLDIPLVQFLDASFAEGHSDDRQALSRPEGDSPARFAQGLKPIGHVPHGLTSPVFNYPYARSRAALDGMRRGGDPDPWNGWKMQFVNPLTGGWAMPTIGAFIQLLPAGFTTRPARATDGTVVAVIAGTGRAVVGDIEMEFGPKDVFVVPSWTRHHFAIDDECVLFSFSDRPVQEKLGLWREDRTP
jgi:gentisate 1,2-dioxygenase